jgi:CheY-like chemotaxis protein/HPt (histidine-containing phosphotransfer) domain-containing protein
VAQETGSTLLRIIDDILDYSKIEAGKLSIEPRPTSVHELVKVTVGFFRSAAGQKGLKIEHHVSPNISPCVRLDGLRLRQLLNNFISNSIKFTESGSIAIRVDLVERQGEREKLRFAVSDTGIGISPEAQKQLFQPFTQADSDISRRYGGTGLGLAICGRLVHLMGGTLDLESAPGEGTELAVTLEVPICDAMEAASTGEGWKAVQADAKTESEPAVWTDQRPILVVDDQPTNLEVLGHQLRQLGLQSLGVGSGEAALKAFGQNDFSLMITDCHMPGMSGYELSQSIRQLEARQARPPMPILGWTADVTAKTSAKFRQAGMDLLLIKPTDLTALESTLRKAFRLDRNGPVRSLEPSLLALAESESTAVLDRGFLAGIVGDDPALIMRLLGLFRDNLADLNARLREARAEQAPGQVRKAAHALRGACAQVGAHAAAAACAALEAATRQDDAAELELAGQRVLGALAALDAELGRLLDPIANADR